ncbi:MAG: hypothetical protein JSW61_05770 [Candidatus Thorarchaeota archaeon]|nr:MAG: hypothetical protein JSW61_05770 [Candidatus Thorarchaeota archaeon]
MSKSSLRTLARDLTVAFRLVSRNVTSFAWAMFGILIVTAIMVGLLIFFVTIPIILTYGIQFLVWLITLVETSWTATSGTVLLGILFIIFLPLLLPVFVALGALYGMAREIVESEGTSASGVFTWYRAKFLSLAGAGVLQFVLIVGPLMPLSYFVPDIIMGNITTEMMALIVMVIIVWVVFSSGFLSLTFPGVIDNLSVVKAARRSISLSRKHVDRVFGIWLTFILVFAFAALPTILGVVFQWFSSIDNEIIIAYSILMLILLLLVVLPAMSIAQTRAYLILSAQSDQSFEPNHEADEFVRGGTYQ